MTGNSKDWKPDTSLELLSDIYTPKVPVDSEFDHITKDIVLSQLKNKDVNFLLRDQGFIGILKLLGGKFAVNIGLEKQKIAMFVNAKRGFDGFERKAQITSAIQYTLKGSKGMTEKAKGLLTGKEAQQNG